MCALLLIDLVNARGTQRNACGNIHRGRSTPTTLGQHAKLRQQQLLSSQIGYVPPFSNHSTYNLQYDWHSSPDTLPEGWDAPLPTRLTETRTPTTMDIVADAAATTRSVRLLSSVLVVLLSWVVQVYPTHLALHRVQYPCRSLEPQ